VDLPCRPEAEVDVVEDEEDGWLYDSSRGFKEQAVVYNRFRKETIDEDKIERKGAFPGWNTPFKCNRPLTKVCSKGCAEEAKRKGKNEANRRWRGRQKEEG